ncbi:MAG TPA: carbon storage regulator CsrA [Clostridia bacterium]|nr:carbon storage regulator CsrA [Clostridia bacterium]
MLVLSRKKNQSIMIGDDIEIIITDMSEDKVKIGIIAPKSLKIFRKELIEEIQDENVKSNLTVKVDINELASIIKNEK